MLALPVTEIFEELEQALAGHTAAVLRAPPGAGKSTAVPLFLKNTPWLQDQKIVMLAPRRLAARAAARRMAYLLKEKVGNTVGYRVRMDTRVGPDTRIEVVTEGVLTRMLQSDASLKGVGLVIFDEFHERNLDADVGLALCLDIQGVLNADLKLLVMSATMETEPVAALLGDAPVIEARGRTFPIETRYVGSHAPSGDMAEVARVVSNAAREQEESILVFLPGAAEIRQVAGQLEKAGLDQRIQVLPLLGDLSPQAQDRAISPAPNGRRKIVLATSIAETSLTIEGVGVVVDSGLQRIPRFVVRNGMSRLVTVPVSKASADQRRGRAGRMGPGVCLRVWSRAVHSSLVPDRRPEILETDLCGLSLILAGWGVLHPSEVKWLDVPPHGAYSKACELLRALGAVDERNAITPHGRKMADLPVHPRLAHMVLMGRRTGHVRAACDLAALLTERDPLRFASGQGDVDLRLRYDLLQARRSGRSFAHAEARVNDGACKQILGVSDRMRRRLGRSKGGKTDTTLSLGQLLAWAFPDRIARRRPHGRGRYVMTCGQGVRLHENDPMAAQDFIVAVEADGKRQDGRVYRAVAYERDALEAQFAKQLEWRSDVRWDTRRQSVTAQCDLSMDQLVVETKPLHQPEESQVTAAMIDGILQNGVKVLPWTKTLRSWQSRVCFLHGAYAGEEEWPDLSDEHLAADLNWLAPYLPGITSLRGLARIDLRSALSGLLSYGQHQRLDTLAPSHWTVPSGSRIPIDYTGKVPVLAVRLQEMFGLEETPVIAAGLQPLLIHLLSPAGRPVQVTQDLAGFWRSSYLDVKKELKGRYPKHHWPDDPLGAMATARVKPKK